MKKTLVVCSLVAMCIIVASTPALANATLYFSNAGSNNYYGTPSFPYSLSVNGGPNQNMMCIGYYEHIYGGESWQATAVPVGNLDPATHLLDYEAAYLFTLAVKDGGANSGLNAAAWYLFEGAPSLDSNAAAYLAAAQSQSYYLGEFPNVILYTAIPGTQTGSDGLPQNFLGTPEPGSLMLLGTGLLGAAGVLRRKFSA